MRRSAINVTDSHRVRLTASHRLARGSSYHQLATPQIPSVVENERALVQPATLEYADALRDQGVPYRACFAGNDTLDAPDLLPPPGEIAAAFGEKLESLPLA